MCKFNIAWVGICKKNNVEGKEYCLEHLNEKCSICGKQATHSCDETNQLVCGTPLCDSLECELQHFYKTHGYAFGTIIELEKELNIKPFKIVISKINYGTGKMADFFNEHYKDRIEVLLMTYNRQNDITFYNAHLMYYIKTKKEINELLKHYSWHDEVFKEKGLFYSEEPIKINEVYTDEFLKTFEKVI